MADEDRGMSTTAGDCSSRALPNVVLITIFACGGAGFLALVIIVVLSRRRIRKAHRREARELKRRKARVQQLCEGASVLEFPMCCISYLDFRSKGRLITHEEARKQQLLHHFDTVPDVQTLAREKCIVFISHQWKSADEPDPTGDDWKAAVLAIECLAATYGRPLDEFVLWIDYTSIPQRNRACQGLSISSLPFYAGFAHFFLVLCPHVVHGGRTHCFESYQRRGWCRLEQFARLAMCGVAHMYTCHGTAEQPAVSISSHLRVLTTAVQVLAGDFTVGVDKAKLVDTLAMLYFRLLMLHAEFAVGARVRHATRGAGLVLAGAAEGHGRVTILFDSGEQHTYNVTSMAKKLVVVEYQSEPPPPRAHAERAGSAVGRTSAAVAPSRDTSGRPSSRSASSHERRSPASAASAAVSVALATARVEETGVCVSRVEQLAMASLIFYARARVRANAARLFPPELFDDLIALIDARLHLSGKPVAPPAQGGSRDVVSVCSSLDPAAVAAAVTLQARARDWWTRTTRQKETAALAVQARVRGHQARARLNRLQLLLPIGESSYSSSSTLPLMSEQQLEHELAALQVSITKIEQRSRTHRRASRSIERHGHSEAMQATIAEAATAAAAPWLWRKHHSHV